MDVVSIVSSVALLAGSAVLNKIIGEASWFAIKSGIHKVFSDDELAECFEIALKKVEKKYPEYVFVADDIRKLKREKVDFHDKTSFVQRLKQEGVTDETVRLVLREVTDEFQRAIFERAKQRESLFRTIVLDSLHSFNMRFDADETILQKIARVYVPSKSYEKAKKTLMKNHLVFLIGPAHIGKTATAYHLLNDLRNDLRIDRILRISNADDYIFFRNEKRIGILLDDPFGKTQYRHTSLSEHIDELQKLAKDSYVVVTSRNYVFQEVKTKSEIGVRVTLNELMVDISEKDYSQNDLSIILHNHLDYYRANNQIGISEYKLGLSNQDLITSNLDFPHNIDLLVREELKKVSKEDKPIEKALEDSKDIVRQVRSWYRNLEESSKLSQKYLVLTIALFPNNMSYFVEKAYSVLLKEVKDKYRMVISCLPIEKLRKDSSSYVTVSGDPDFLHPSYREGILYDLRSRNELDGEVVLSMLEKMSKYKISTIQVNTMLPMLKALAKNIPISNIHSDLKYRSMRRHFPSEAGISFLIEDIIKPLRKFDRLGGDEKTRLIEDIKSRLNEQNKISIVEALGEIGEIDINRSAHLLFELAEELDWAISITEALANIGKRNPDALIPYIEKLRRESPKLRANIAQNLLEDIGEDKPDEILQYLADLSKGADQSGRIVAANVLIEIGSLRPTESMSILRILAKDESPLTRSRVALALGEIGKIRTEECWIMLNKFLKDAHPQVRSSAAEVLGVFSKAKADECFVLLSDLARDQNWEVRSSVAIALSDVDLAARDKALKILRELTKDEDWFVEWCAENSIIVLKSGNHQHVNR